MYSEACGASDLAIHFCPNARQAPRGDVSNEALKGEAEAGMHMHASCSSLACDTGSSGALSPRTVSPISSVMALNPMPESP